MEGVNGNNFLMQLISILSLHEQQLVSPVLLFTSVHLVITHYELLIQIFMSK